MGFAANDGGRCSATLGPICDREGLICDNPTTLELTPFRGHAPLGAEGVLTLAPFVDSCELE
jgi:hypothetical protein